MNCSPLSTDIQQERLHSTLTLLHPPPPPPHSKYPILYLVLSPYSLGCVCVGGGGGGGEEGSNIKSRRSADYEYVVIVYIACYWPFLRKRY